MPTNCQELMDFASQLGTTCTLQTEQIPRTSAHKAYYSVYHFLKLRFPDADQYSQLADVPGSHNKFVQGLKIESSSYPDKKNQLIRIADGLDGLKNLRVRADYKLDREFAESTAQEAVRQAQRLIDKCQTHF